MLDLCINLKAVVYLQIKFQPENNRIFRRTAHIPNVPYLNKNLKLNRKFHIFGLNLS